MSGRRDQILSTAAELFAERGFHGVSVSDIGAACGISGPALYKHFLGKEAMLAEMLIGISEQLLAVGQQHADLASDPVSGLHRLVDAHVDFALDRRDLIVVQDRDWGSLPGQARERVRELQLAYVEVWAGLLRQVHEGLGPQEARAMVQAAFGLINSTPHSGRLAAQRMRRLLADMANRALAIDADRIGS